MSMEWSGRCNGASGKVGQCEWCTGELHLESMCFPYSEDQLPACVSHLIFYSNIWHQHMTRGVHTTKWGSLEWALRFLFSFSLELCCFIFGMGSECCLVCTCINFKISNSNSMSNMKQVKFYGSLPQRLL
jgi:hypothetical protein